MLLQTTRRDHPGTPCWRSSSSPFHEESPWRGRGFRPACPRRSRRWVRLRRDPQPPAVSSAAPAGESRSLGPAPSASKFGGGLGSSSASSMTLVSSSSRNMRLQFEGGQLQQPDGLLQLRRHRQLLAEAELQGGFQHLVLSKPRYMRKFWPKYTSRTRSWQGFPRHFRTRSPFRGPRCRHGCRQPVFRARCGRLSTRPMPRAASWADDALYVDYRKWGRRPRRAHPEE